MNTHPPIKLAFLVCAAISCVAASAQETNATFLPVEVTAAAEGRANAEYNARERESAIRHGECKAAETDPQGNWGQVVGGFQLSIRPYTNVFVKGQPMTVSVIFRNTTTNDLTAPAGPNNPDVFVVDDSGHERSALSLQGFSGSMSILMPAQRQRKERLDLSYGFGTRDPGTYRIYATQRVFGPPDNPGKMRELRSGTATISLVGGSPSADQRTDGAPRLPK
jgi:hypothetical protein